MTTLTPTTPPVSPQSTRPTSSVSQSTRPPITDSMRLDDGASNRRRNNSRRDSRRIDRAAFLADLDEYADTADAVSRFTLSPSSIISKL